MADKLISLAAILLVTLLYGACHPSSAKAQDDVPEVVVNRFLELYPAAEAVDWNIDRNNSFEAHFQVKGNKARADFEPNGTWIETEESIKWDELPEAVQRAIKSEYDKDDIVELEHTVSATKGEFYDVEIDPKGEKKFDIEYRADGTISGRE